MDLGCFWGITGNFRLCSLVKPVKLLLRPLLKQLNPPPAESGFSKPVNCCGGLCFTGLQEMVSLGALIIMRCGGLCFIGLQEMVSLGTLIIMRCGGLCFIGLPESPPG